jgi:O-antigen/teichoic acid export membrane protein
VKQSQRIAKNALAGGLSISVGGLLQLGTVVLVARHVSVADFGAFSFMIACEFVVFRLADCGISNILMRDLAVQPDITSDLLGAALSWAGLLSILTVVLTFSVVRLLRIQRTLGLMTLAMSLDGVGHFAAGCYGAVLLSREDNELYAIGYILHKVAILSLVTLSLILKFGLVGVIPAYIVGTLIQWGFYRWLVIKFYTRPNIKVDFALWKYLIANSVPVGGAGVLRLAAEQADVVILTWLLGIRAAGLFSGPYRIISGVRFLPMTVMISLYPLLARTAASPASRPEFEEAYQRSVKLFALIAFPVAAVLAVCPDTLTVSLLGSSYKEAGTATGLLSAGAWLMIMAQPFPFLLTALGRQRFLLTSSVIALALRVGADLALVPILNIAGPCVTVSISELTLILVWMRDLRQCGFSLRPVSIFWRPCLAAVVMSAVLYLANPRSLLSLVCATVVSGLIYAGTAFQIGAISAGELELVKDGVGFLRVLLGAGRRLAPGKV